MPRSYRRFSRQFKMTILQSILKGAVASQVAKTNDLQREEIWVRAYVDFDDARDSIGPFIHGYNENRSHSSLGKRSLAEFERMYHRALRANPCKPN